VKSVGHRQATSVDWLAPCVAQDRSRSGVALGLATSHCEFVFGQACRWADPRVRARRQGWFGREQSRLRV